MKTIIKIITSLVLLITFGISTQAQHYRGGNGDGFALGKSIPTDFTDIMSAKPAQMETLKLNAFPNPNNGSFAVQLDEITTEAYQLEVVDFLGKAIPASQIKISKNGNTIQIDIKGNPSGLYFVRIILSNKTYISKINIY